MIFVKKIQSSEDLKIAFAIRKKVFVEEQGVPLAEEYDEFESSSLQFLAFLNETPVGTARMRTTPKGTKLERFAVLKEFRGLEIGSNLVKNLLTNCKNDIDSQVYLYAQIAAQKFYEKLGFEAKGETFLDAGIDHVEMHYKEKRSSK